MSTEPIEWLRAVCLALPGTEEGIREVDGLTRRTWVEATADGFEYGRGATPRPDPYPGTDLRRRRRSRFAIPPPDSSLTRLIPWWVWRGLAGWFFGASGRALTRLLGGPPGTG